MIAAMMSAGNAANALQEDDAPSLWFDLAAQAPVDTTLTQQRLLMPENMFDSTEDVDLMMRAMQGFHEIGNHSTLVIFIDADFHGGTFLPPLSQHEPSPATAPKSLVFPGFNADLGTSFGVSQHAGAPKKNSKNASHASSKSCQCDECIFIGVVFLTLYCSDTHVI